MAEEAPKQPLAIEARAESEEDTIKLNVTTGESVSLFDKLGPTIVSAEGVSRSAPGCTLARR